jgi:hypothetical protein
MKDKTDDPAPPGQPAERNYSGDWRPIPDHILAVIVAIVAAVLVLGYLFLNKMADISTEEDCALARRSNCAPIELNR